MMLGYGEQFLSVTKTNEQELRDGSMEEVREVACGGGGGGGPTKN